MPKRGGKRPNTGGNREGSGRKTRSGRTERITISIRPDLKEKIKASGKTPTEFIENALILFFEMNKTESDV